MERVVFGVKERCSRATGDRFIPLRSTLQSRRKHKATPCEKTSLFETITTSHSLAKRNYIKYLDSALRIPAGDEKIFNFSNEQQVREIFSTSRKRKKYPEAETWPCRPRKRPFIGSADSVLDLPNFGVSEWNCELVDWSRSDMLLAALGSKTYVWSWRSQSLVCSLQAAGLANCGKFSPVCSDSIAVALDSGEVETLAVSSGKHVWSQSCYCEGQCSVTALDWSPTGKSLVLGCSQGGLTVMDEYLNRICRRSRAHVTPVVRVRISPDARYLATLGLRDTGVSIWQWPHLKPYFLFQNYSIVKSLCWHPWRSSMLAIGGCCARAGSCVLAVWDVAAATLRQPAVKCGSDLAVDCMLFSPVTGELVLSCWIEDAVKVPHSGLSEPGSRIMVLSDPSTEVDKWVMPDRVSTMVFSPDGTKLAIATAEEELVILYFLPEEPKWKNKNCSRSHSRLAVMLDVAENGVSKR